jgi:hypothetical protein
VSQPEIAPGDSGDLVTELQTRLSALDRYSGALDGQYGALTGQAVVELQKEKGLTADGTVGAQTWTALEELETAAGHGQPALGALSEDQQWRWGDEGWEPAHSQVAPEAAPTESSVAGHVSSDGQWLWDGSRWQPVVG